jgi:hypothetical protein
MVFQERPMSIFTPDEIEYLESGLLGRLATVGPDGTPHIAPVGMISSTTRERLTHAPCYSIIELSSITP